MEKEIYGMGIALLGALTNPEHEEDNKKILMKTQPFVNTDVWWVHWIILF